MSCIPINDFSLITLCDATKAGKLYSIVPDSGAGDFDVSRNSSATVLDKDGKIKRIGANVPAVGFNFDGSYKGLYIRSSLTNLFRDSEPATDPGQGTRNNVTFDANDWGIGLDGKVTVDNQGGTVNAQYTNVSGTTSETLTVVSAIVRRVDGQPPVERLQAASLVDTDFALLAGGIGTAATLGSSTDSFNFKDDLWFVRKIFISSGVTAGTYGVYKASNYSENTVEVSAIMVVQGDVDLTIQDYIRTTGSTATRPADVITKTAASALIGQTEGVIQLQADLITSGLNQTISELYNDTDNYINIRKNTSNEIVATLVVAGSIVGTVTSSVQTSGKKDITFSYQTGTCTLTVNGVDTTATATDVPTADKIKLGSRQNNTEFWNSHIQVKSLRPQL